MQDDHAVPSTSRQTGEITQIPCFSEYSRNPYINFSRTYHRKGRPASETIKEAARDWRRLSSEEKELYRRQAEAAPYRAVTRHKTLSRIIKLLNPPPNKSEDQKKHPNRVQSLLKVRKIVQRWKLQSHRSTIFQATTGQTTRRPPKQSDQNYVDCNKIKY
ncbi:uncharacterized protein LOC129731783 [Wyeomyia smithii]|uniref:uncharacterized protein LOC129731783 n=1 Tax=Wyeomyia smithii TaxID=174621 RepID=UPI0024681097|nr:uncharacterized protein LOC129731783 [Wyeomyia smithii]